MAGRGRRVETGENPSDSSEYADPEPVTGGVLLDIPAGAICPKRGAGGGRVLANTASCVAVAAGGSVTDNAPPPGAAAARIPSAGARVASDLQRSAGGCSWRRPGSGGNSASNVGMDEVVLLGEGTSTPCEVGRNVTSWLITAVRGAAEDRGGSSGDAPAPRP